MLLEKQNKCIINYNKTTRRFNQAICDFVNSIYNDKDNFITPYNQQNNEMLENIGVFIIDKKYLKQYCNYYSPTILRYNRDTSIEIEKCNILTYGSSKGSTFNRVVIVPISTVMPFILDGKQIRSKQTKAKFYVACTRAKHSLVFAIDNAKPNKQFLSDVINIGAETIPCFKYNVNL